MRALPAADRPRMERLLPGDPGGPEAPRDQDAAPARRSAVERLAADRAKYVRGRPAIARGPASDDSSPAASDPREGDPRSPARAPGAVARRAMARRPLRPDSLVIYRQKCEFVRGPGAASLRGALVRKLFPGPAKDRTPALSATSPAGGEGRARGEEAARPAPAPAAPHAPPAAPRTPQPPPAPPAAPRTPQPPPAPPAAPRTPQPPPAPPAAPRTPQPPPAPPAAPRTPQPPPAPPAAPRTPQPQPPPAPPAASRIPQPRGSRRRGLQRSQSDLSSRYSRSLAELDAFFQFCGLQPEVVEALGRENFSAGSERGALGVRSVSVATSDSGFSRHSGGGYEGLQEEELAEQVPSTTSVIERNARIIKWLYTCKKATETPGQGLQGPA